MRIKIDCYVTTFFVQKITMGGVYFFFSVLLAVLLYVADAIPRRCLPVDWQSHTEPERSGGGGEGTAATIREVEGKQIIRRGGARYVVD